MSNMALEDLMNALAHWGSVTVRRIRFPSAASPHLKGKAVLWSAEVRIPGYKNEYGQPYFKFEGRDIRQAVEQCYEAAETYLFSDQGRAERKAAEDAREIHNRWVRRDNPSNLGGNSGRPRLLPPINPDVAGPNAPDIETETYQ